MPRTTYGPTFYDARWRTRSRAWLKQHPDCHYCAQRRTRTPAVIVDHIRPHRGDLTLFWNERNWMGLCRTCHNAAKQREEKRGHVIGCDEKGQPLDPHHTWNAKIGGIQGENGARK